MKVMNGTCRAAIIFLVVGMLAGCAATTPAGPSYSVSQNAPPAGAPPAAPLMVGPNDVYYSMRIDDRTPFGLQQLPEAMDTLYQKGYDQVRREKESDFSIDIAFSAMTRDNPEARTANVIGGALLGAATGAIIGGGAFGHPGAGAAVGAGALGGAVTPVNTPMVRIDINVRSRDGSASSQSATMDLASVPPPDVQIAIDHQVARMLQTLPSR